MLDEQTILKRLQNKGWTLSSLSGQMDNGSTALMNALSLNESQSKYEDQDLVEALLKHPSTDVHAQDNQGHNALWYVYDFKHAFPLLAQAGLDFNQLDDDGEHFLISELFWIDFNHPEKLNFFKEYLETAVRVGHIDLFQNYDDEPFWTHFPSILEPLIQSLMAEQTKTQLSTIPLAQNKSKHSRKL